MGWGALYNIPQKNKKGAAEAAPFRPLSRNIEGHPNPVRIRMFSDAAVKPKHYCSAFPLLDLSGASW